MKKIQIFVGPPDSGKTRAAEKATAGKVAYWINLRVEKSINSDPFLFQYLTSDVEYLVFDDVQGKKMIELIHFLIQDLLKINRMGKMPLVIPMPKAIIVTEEHDWRLILPSSARHILDIVDFPTPTTNSQPTTHN